MSLTGEQRGLLRELQADPRWKGILDEIRREPPSPYRPSDESTEDQFRKWLFESGRYRENDKVLKLLTGERNV